MRYIGYITIKSVLEVGIEAKSKREAKEALEEYFESHDYDESCAEFDSASVSSNILSSEEFSDDDWDCTADQIDASDYLEEESEKD